MEDGTGLIDVLAAVAFALWGVGWLAGGAIVMASGGLTGSGLGAVLFGIPALALGLVFLYIAWGIHSRKREAWGIGVALIVFMLAWGAVAMGLSWTIPSTSELLNLLFEVGLLAYLLLRRQRFGVGRITTPTAPPKAGPAG